MATITINPITALLISSIIHFLSVLSARQPPILTTSLVFSVFSSGPRTLELALRGYDLSSLRQNDIEHGEVIKIG
jgi:hypothetical protein